MSETIRLDKNVALVTGSGRGPGHSQMLKLAMRGAHVVVNEHSLGLFGERADHGVTGEVVR